jgi:hypothetical protein
MNEVRSTAGSPQGEPVAKPDRNKSIAGTGAHRVGGDGMSGSAKLMNQGYLSRCWKERGRSQSPHSSDEAGNDRGAKEGRKVEA